ncbi:hypothetical protein HDU79_008039 [Rhizoclosmatium sp. JEL0117]|nr:hypothetical protein HDU79_008039 [Rhizoclosmatium sp. JEL0117]
MADRMKLVGGHMIVKANMSGEFVMLIENDMVKLETFYEDLDNPAIDPSQVEPSQQPSLNRDPKEFAQVRVDIRDFIKFCIIENHGLVFYVYIGENGGENIGDANGCGTITYYRFKIRQIGQPPQHHSFFFPQSPSSMSPALMTATENLKTLDFTMDHAHLLEGSAVVIQWAFPHWDMSEAKLVQQTHGITNKLVKCTYKGETVLIRTYGKGTDAIIDRNQEMNNMMVLSRNGLSPKVHGRFTNGLIYGYVDGIPFSVEDMSHPHKSTLVARHLANWHKVDASDIMSTKPKLFNTLHQWVDAIPKQFSNPAVDASFRSFITVDRLKKELTGLQVELEKVNAPIVFSHCDLLTGNIIFNAEKDRVDFIDYEYGSYNPRGFDIGNHFCEHAGFDCEWDLYPNQEFQRKWLREYLGSAHPDQEVTEDEITKLYAEVNKYALAAHLYWGIWALVQAEISDLDFDYAGYAKLRIDEYFRRKTGFLAL